MRRVILKRRRTATEQEALDLLDQFLDTASPELILLIRTFWEDQQKLVTLKSIREGIERGYLDESILQVWDRDYLVFLDSSLKPKWYESLISGSQAWTSGRGFAFDPMADGVQRWIEENGARWVSRISENQREAIRTLLSSAAESGLPADALSRQIRPCIGLTTKQAAANQRYFRHITDTLVDRGVKLENALIQARDAAAEYAAKQRAERAYTIATTEMAYAYNEGAHYGVKQAQALGLMGQVVKRWSTADDDGVCEICAALGEMEPIPVDGRFDFEGRSLYNDQMEVPPAHPRCRCAIVYEEVLPIW